MAKIIALHDQGRVVPEAIPASVLSNRRTDITDWSTAPQHFRDPCPSYRLCVDVRPIRNAEPLEGCRHEHGPDPGRTVVGLQGDRSPVREPDRVARLRPRLADRPWYGAQQRGLVAAAARGVLGKRPDGISLPTLGSFRRGGDGAERAREPAQGGRQQRRPAAVDRYHLDRLAGEVCERLGDGDLQGG